LLLRKLMVCHFWQTEPGKETLDPVSDGIQPVEKLPGEFVKGRGEDELAIGILPDAPQPGYEPVFDQPQQITVKGPIRDPNPMILLKELLEALLRHEAVIFLVLLCNAQ